MLEIMRGTTPTITCNVDANLSGYTCYLEFGQPNTPNVRVENPTVTTSGSTSTVRFTMTQEETLKLKSGKNHVQLAAVNAVGSGEVVVMTHLVDVRVYDPIRPKVIHDVC